MHVYTTILYNKSIDRSYNQVIRNILYEIKYLKSKMINDKRKIVVF
jgi:hypothetical protein